jgi:histidinol-phosphate aminotransferase
MQTFSKAFGLAAVRVGMAFSSTDIIQYFNKLKPPYNISTINQKAALRKLGKTDEFRKQVKKIKEERERLTEILKKMKVTEKVYPSDANFLLIRVKDANFVYNTLIDKNIIVRNRNSVIGNCIRITVGKPYENNKLINALKSI